MGLYGWTGFFPPLDPDSMGTVINSGKAGKTYPVKFQLLDQTGQYISSLSAVTSIAYAPSSACSGSSSDPIDYTATDSVSGLRYESGANQFIYNWASPSKAGCYLLKISLADNSARLALFSLK
jgi:hypothetical protein